MRSTMLLVMAFVVKTMCDGFSPPPTSPGLLVPLVGILRSRSQHAISTWNARALFCAEPIARSDKTKELRSIMQSSTSTLVQEAHSEHHLTKAAFWHLKHAYHCGYSHGSPSSHGGCINIHKKADFPKETSFKFKSLVRGRMLVSEI